MWDVIRASDIEDNSDAIKLPEWTVDLSWDTPQLPGDEEKYSEEIIPYDKDNKSDDTTQTDEVNLDNISDAELEAMSDDELDKLLSWIEDDQEDKTEQIDWESTEEDVEFALKEKDALLKSVSDRLEKKVRENADLKVQLAEKNIFSEDGDADMNALHTNMWKARWGDEAAKRDVITYLDKIRKEMTWKTFSEDDLDKETDKISDSNSIKSVTDPSTPSKQDFEEEVRVL